VTPARYNQITSQYQKLNLGVVGDICLDRYLEIDPSRQERSIETGLPVHNVINVRTSPGAAGTVINNLCALGVGCIYPVGFLGDDAEGWELDRALQKLTPVSLKHFQSTPLRRTFTYAKPLVLRPGRSPQELSRLDFKNWSRTPPELERRLVASIRTIGPKVHGFIILDQVDLAGTGVVTAPVLKALQTVAKRHRQLFILADSRRGLHGFPPFIWKMNRAELAGHARTGPKLSLSRVKAAAASLAKKNRRAVFVTLAETGIVGAAPSGEVRHVAALPIRGDIDIVGAGDAVTANLLAALVCGASMGEAMELAMCAASIVIHKLGTTGTASRAEMKHVLDL
jgi:rfaE bifunctional protein kinase chain/domain